MTDSSPSYRRLFWKSRQHLWLAILTLGLGFASGEPLGLLAGVTAYALGLVFVPDAGFFRRAVDDRRRLENEAETARHLAAFKEQQTQLLQNLSPARRERYQGLTAVCVDIEKASREAESATGMDVQSGLRKLDELMWTFLRMLSIEQSLDVYLETERRENVPALVQSLEEETKVLAAQAEQAKRAVKKPLAPNVQTPAERLLTSHLERLAALQQRAARIQQAHENLTLVRSEQARLLEQVKLIRADAVAAKNADALSARIDLSIAHLAATNQWLSELSEFKDLTQQLPETSARTGYVNASPAPAGRKAGEVHRS